MTAVDIYIEDETNIPKGWRAKTPKGQLLKKTAELGILPPPSRYRIHISYDEDDHPVHDTVDVELVYAQDFPEDHQVACQNAIALYLEEHELDYSIDELDLEPRLGR